MYPIHFAAPQSGVRQFGQLTLFTYLLQHDKKNEEALQKARFFSCLWVSVQNIVRCSSGWYNTFTGNKPLYPLITKSQIMYTKTSQADKSQSNLHRCSHYRGADKSLARPGTKQARKHVRDARDFNNIETRVVKFFFFL